MCKKVFYLCGSYKNVRPHRNRQKVNFCSKIFAHKWNKTAVIDHILAFFLGSWSLWPHGDRLCPYSHPDPKKWATRCQDDCCECPTKTTSWRISKKHCSPIKQSQDSAALDSRHAHASRAWSMSMYELRSDSLQANILFSVTKIQSLYFLFFPPSLVGEVCSGSGQHLQVCGILYGSAAHLCCTRKWTLHRLVLLTSFQ